MKRFKNFTLGKFGTKKLRLGFLALMSVLMSTVGYSQTDFTIGTGTSTNTNTGQPSPFYDWYEGDRHQFLYRASELQAAGMGPGLIYAIKWDVVNTNGSNPQGWTMYIGTTTVNSLTSTFQPTPSYKVFGPASTTFAPTAGVNTYTLATPFFWNGTDNIIIQTCHGVGNTCRGFTRNAAVRYTNPGFAATTYYRTDCSGSMCNRTTGTTINNRPNVILNWGPLAYNNAAVKQITQPAPGFCAGTETIAVEIANNGINKINDVLIYWSVDGVPAANSPINYTTPIDIAGSPAGNTAEVVLGNVTFGAAPRNIEVYTSMPNGGVDTTNYDDTLREPLGASLAGTYVVGPNGGDYATVKEAADALNQWGVCGPVTMEIQPSVYTDQVVLKDIIGTNNTNRVTFKSQNGVPSSVIVSYAATGTEYVWGFDNSSYITVKDITIQSGTQNAGRVIELFKGSSYDSIINCDIVSTLAPVLSSTNANAIYTDQLTGESDVLLNNRIKGGYYGIFWEGTGTTNLTENHVVEGNTIEDAYYMSARFYYHDNLKFRNNVVRSLGNPFTHYATYFYYCDGATEYMNNDILMTAISGTGTKYGMYIRYNDGNSSEQSNIVNNVIAIDNSTNNGDAYGIYCYYSKYQNYVNNSVNINSKSANSNAARFYYSSSTYGNNNIVNNIFADETGSGYTMYVYNGNNSYNNYWDYNNISNPKGNLIQQASPAANYKTLTDWRTAYGMDQHSITYDPGFMSTTDLHPDPSKSASWSVNGRALHINGNGLDADGNPRITQRADGTPDLGAYEFTPSSATLPPVATAVPATITPGGTQEFFFGEVLVATVEWNTDLKVVSPLNIRQYSGAKAPNFNNNQFMYFHTTIDNSAPGTTWNYDIDVNYSDIWLGTIATESDLRLAHRYKSNPWIGYNGAASTVNTNNNLLSANTLVNFGDFTGTVDGEIFSAFITPASSTIICTGHDVVLNANTGAGYTYQWTRNGIEIPGATSASYTANQVGDYTVKITTTNPSATAESFPVTVTVIAAPNAPVTANSTLTYCPGGNLQLSTQQGSALTYQWKLNGNNIPGATNDAYNVNASGTYTVVVENTGCATESTPQVVDAGPLNVDLGQDISTCAIDKTPVELDAGYPGAKYTWNTGDNSQKIQVYQSGDYVVTVDAGPNCIDTDTISVKIDPLPFVQGIVFVQNGNTYTFTPGGELNVSGYTWIFSDGTTSSKQTVTKTINDNNLYVRLIVYNNCGADTSQLGWPLSISNKMIEENVTVFPNPAKDKVTFKVNGTATIKQISLINNVGAVVENVELENGNKEYSFDIQALPAGYYMLKAETDNGIVSKPFTISK